MLIESFKEDEHEYADFYNDKRVLKLEELAECGSFNSNIYGDAKND